MSLRAAFVLIFCFGLLCFASQAGAQTLDDVPSPPDLQKRAEEMLARARQLSDIRAAGAPAFHLKAVFSFRNNDLDLVDGTYTEDWVSNSQWHREIVVHDQPNIDKQDARGVRRIEVGGPSKYWVFDSIPNFPEPPSRLSAALVPLPPIARTFTFASMQEGIGDPPSACAITSEQYRRELQAFCFATKAGFLLETVSREAHPMNLVNYSCSYGMFEKFGTYSFPREVICSVDHHRGIAVQILEIAPEPTPDPALFTPPPGATEIGICSGDLVPPTVAARPMPRLSPMSEAYIVQVELSLVVDPAGKIEAVKLLHPRDEKSNEKALRDIREWRFKPATCDGQPMPMKLNVNVNTLFFY
jgi:TonB family protein